MRFSMTPRLLIGAVAVFGAFGACNPDVPVSQPNGFTPFRQSETSAVYVAATDTIIVTYNDLSGFDEVGASNLVPKTPGLKNGVWDGQSFAGYAVLPNIGSNLAFAPWKPQPPIQPLQPQPPLPGKPPQLLPLIMRGDPAVATNGKRLLYANLAYTDFDDLRNVPRKNGVERGPDALAIAVDDTGTGAFGAPYVAGQFPGVFVDQSSLSMVGNTAVAAFNDGQAGARLGDIWLLTTDSSGTPSQFWAPENLVTDPVNRLTNWLGGRGRAIVKLASPTLGYLAYMEDDFTAANGKVIASNAHYVVVRLTRSGLGAPWDTQEIFRFQPLFSTAVSAPGRSVDGKLSQWQDLNPLGFDIGNGGTELHLVARDQASPGVPSSVRYFHCDDTAFACANFSNWTREAFQTAPGGEFQPWVVADPRPGISFAAVSWYQQQGGTDRFQVVGVEVGSDQATPHVVQPLQFGPFEPCLTPTDPNTGLQTFGDYESSVWLPYSSTNFLESRQQPQWATMYTRSTQCTGKSLDGLTLSNVVTDQAIGATRWSAL